MIIFRQFLAPTVFSVCGPWRFRRLRNEDLYKIQTAGIDQFSCLSDSEKSFSDYKMKANLNLILVLCTMMATVESKYNKCGEMQETCVLLSNGNLFWPSDWTKSCSLTAMCPPGYYLKKQMLGKLRACCCMLRNIVQCPDCEMRRANQISFSDWFDWNISRNGPPDGTCPSSKVKRILFGKGLNQLDKCCCEPLDSPFLHEVSQEDWTLRTHGGSRTNPSDQINALAYAIDDLRFIQLFSVYIEGAHVMIASQSVLSAWTCCYYVLFLTQPSSGSNQLLTCKRHQQTKNRWAFDAFVPFHYRGTSSNDSCCLLERKAII